MFQFPNLPRIFADFCSRPRQEMEGAPEGFIARKAKGGDLGGEDFFRAKTETRVQGGPLAVINGVIIPINGLVNG